jgi:hypothetical protein
METRFAFLERLEDQLTEVAKADTRRMSAESRRGRSSTWKAWGSAVAALLGIALLVGLAQGLMGGASSNQFSSVGAAVNVVGTIPKGADVPAAGYGTDQGAAGGAPSGTPAAASPNGQGRAGTTADLSKIIRDGQIAVTIGDGTFDTARAQVSHIAAVNGGSVLSASTSGGDSGSFTLRIPAANFEKAMNQLATLGTVDSSAIHGQDVTAQYVDLKAHMKIYLARRKVLFGLMLQANTIGETITLQNQLEDVQLKIDQITGQLNYINKQVAESTIKVDLHEPGAVVATSPTEINNPSLGRAWDHAVQGSLNVLAAVTIGLGYLIPLLAIAGLGYLVVRFARGRRPAASPAS